MAIISFASSKGGAGKTTSCIVLATELAQGTTVTIIDADPARRVIRWSKRGTVPANMRVVQCCDEREIGNVIRNEQEHSTVILIDLEGSASRLNTSVIARSNLVIVPMGDEQQDATDAVETMKEIRVDEEMLGRKIPARILFTRTKAAVKSRFAKQVNNSMRENVPCFQTELIERTAYSNLHNAGGGLRDLPDGVGGVDKAIVNAQTFMREVLEVLKQSVEEAA